MSGRFDGLTDIQWRLLEPLLPKDPLKRGKGKHHTPWRNICNSLFWILITGSRWCDLPEGPPLGIKICHSSMARSMARKRDFRQVAFHPKGNRRSCRDD